MGESEREGLLFIRESLQCDIKSGISPNDWDLDAKRVIHEQLNPNGFYVYDKNGEKISFEDEFKLYDFCNV